MKFQSKHIYPAAALILCVLMSFIIESFAYRTNGSFGFPLDDPWIHLTFAKNLHDYGAFSYYKNEMVTSGSTSPLYTIMLALGFFLTNNEMLLSYFLGVFFFLVGGVFLFKLTEHVFKGSVFWPSLAVLLYALEPRLQWIALSGMETTLFIALLLAVAYYSSKQMPVHAGICAGLLIWTRPEAIIMIAIVGVDVYYRQLVDSRTKSIKKMQIDWLMKAGLVALVFGVGYVVFNLALSGSILPNTYAAKVKYYSGGGQGFPRQVLAFLTAGHMIVLAPTLLIGITSTLVSIVRKRSAPFLVPLLFSGGLFIAYWIKLPYLYQNGRYLMPMLPFVIFLALDGAYTLTEYMRKRFKHATRKKAVLVVQTLLAMIFVVPFANAAWEIRLSYQDYCKYISDRQVKSALWMRDHLPPSAIIATHDVGAIGFYSGRKIVDMVGLVSPEMIANLGDLSKLLQSLIREHVTHLAVLRNWFEIVNVNPIFHTSEQSPEIMEVFAFDPTQMHFTAKNVSMLTTGGEGYLMRGDVRSALQVLQAAAQYDPLSSRVHNDLGWALLRTVQLDAAEGEFQKALRLHPTYWEARLAMSQISLSRNRPQEAIYRLNELVRDNPGFLVGYQTLEQIYSQLGDTTNARLVREHLLVQSEKISDP
jgi:tetratricopeptide (TPR) repeat protein